MSPDAVAREDEELRLHDGELRMNAYYYGFGKTGVIEVDRILAAVACAGKGCHNTEGWVDLNYPELIQQWADKAAKAFRDAAAAASLAERIVEVGFRASAHVADQYGGIEYVPRDVVRAILIAVLAPRRPMRDVTPEGEAVAWAAVKDGGPVVNGRVWADRATAERFVRNERSYVMQQPRLGYEIVPLYTHPPRATVTDVGIENIIQRLVLTFGGEGYTNVNEVEAELRHLVRVSQAAALAPEGR